MADQQNSVRLTLMAEVSKDRSREAKLLMRDFWGVTTTVVPVGPTAACPNLCRRPSSRLPARSAALVRLSEAMLAHVRSLRALDRADARSMPFAVNA